MRSISLDFIKRPRFSARLIALIWLGLIFVALSYWLHEQKAVELYRMQKKLAVLKQAGQAMPKNTSTPESQSVQKEIGSALQRLALPWGTLFVAIEAPSNESVVLLELQPDVERSQVLLTGEAKDFESLGRYVEELEDQEVLNNVYLVSHQVQLQSPVRQIRFVVRADWRLSLNGNKN